MLVTNDRDLLSLSPQEKSISSLHQEGYPGDTKSKELLQVPGPQRRAKLQSAAEVSDSHLSAWQAWDT